MYCRLYVPPESPVPSSAALRLSMSRTESSLVVWRKMSRRRPGVQEPLLDIDVSLLGGPARRPVSTRDSSVLPMVEWPFTMPPQLGPNDAIVRASTMMLSIVECA